MIRTTELAMGSRLKILSDSLYAMGDRIYRDNNIPFQARWFPIIYVLHQQGPSAVTELARELGVTHSAVSQLARKIIKNGLVQNHSDPGDERRRILSLSPKGEALCERMVPVWDDILHAIREVISHSGVDLMNALASFERELEKESLDVLVRKRMQARQGGSVEILQYQSEYRAEFKRLNVEWLEKHFYVEKIDDDILSNPEEYILKPGGFIFFAKCGDEIVGTSALIKHSDMFELAKMAVTEKYQGLKIGKKLADVAIDKARALGQRQIFLETNSKLKPALNLYKKLGFVDAPYPGGKSEHYQRSDTYMVLILK